MNSSLVGVTRWAARCAALVVSGGFFFLLFGEIASPHSGSPNLVEAAEILLLTIAIVALILAMSSVWKWELAGALISLAALAAWTYCVRMRRYSVVGLIALPGILFLLDVLLRARQGNPTSGLASTSGSAGKPPH